MNKAYVKRLNKKIDKILIRKSVIIFPIMGGLSDNPSQLSRNVTPKEAAILLSKGTPVPISIALNREKEFLEYLES